MDRRDLPGRRAIVTKQPYPWGWATTIIRPRSLKPARSHRHSVCIDSAPLTPERYWLALVLFHLVVLAASWRLVKRWADPLRCRPSTRSWLVTLVRDVGGLAIFTYGVSLVAPFLANYDHPKRLHIGEISGRFMGQALFGEAILLSIALALLHRRAAQRSRAGALGAVALALCAIYAEAYRLEPHRLQVRRHLVERPDDPDDAPAIRILHITDIQTPAIGVYEEAALRTGLSYRPDLIVLTGDYVQDALGRSTEERAARDLRELVARLPLQAPLGVFATEGDVGPPCLEVFARTPVRCLTDESAVVTLPGRRSLKITGLSRGRGRERDPVLLGALIARGGPADYSIVMSHSPDFVAALRQRVDLALAGHTHGGQFVLPFLGPIVTASRLPRRYAADLHYYKGTPLHVSRGVGMERGFSPPVRFLCPPEICLVDMRIPARPTEMANANR